jgi:hypothetical protein
MAIALHFTTLHPFARLLQVSFFFFERSTSSSVFLFSFTFVLLTFLNLPQGCSWKCERLLRPSRALHRDDSKEAQAAQALINAPI